VSPLLFSLIGLADAIYLTVEHLSGRSVRCTLSGCSEVLSSPYATVRGIPLAAIGAFAYFTVFSLATLAAFGYRVAGKVLTLIVRCHVSDHAVAALSASFRHRPLLPVLSALSFSDTTLTVLAIIAKGGKGKG